LDEKIIALSYNAMTILVPVLCAILIELIRRKLGLENCRKIQAELQTKQVLATLAIKMAEQAFKDLHGQDKYDQAATWLATQAGERGIKVTPNEVKGLIEAALRMAKDEFGEEWAKREEVMEEVTMVIPTTATLSGSS
jgi:LL-H family phage holin